MDTRRREALRSSSFAHVTRMWRQLERAPILLQRRGATEREHSCDPSCRRLLTPTSAAARARVSGGHVCRTRVHVGGVEQHSAATGGNGVPHLQWHRLVRSAPVQLSRHTPACAAAGWRWRLGETAFSMALGGVRPGRQAVGAQRGDAGVAQKATFQRARVVLAAVHCTVGAALHFPCARGRALPADMAWRGVLVAAFVAGAACGLAAPTAAAELVPERHGNALRQLAAASESTRDALWSSGVIRDFRHTCGECFPQCSAPGPGSLRAPFTAGAWLAGAAPG
jgi:hypothetical protein